MWASKIKTVTPYLSVGVVATGTSYLVFRSIGKGEIQLRDASEMTSKKLQIDALFETNLSLKHH